MIRDVLGRFATCWDVLKRYGGVLRHFVMCWGVLEVFWDVLGMFSWIFHKKLTLKIIHPYSPYIQFTTFAAFHLMGPWAASV